MSIFVPSTSFNYRGLHRLAFKAGFFCALSKGILLPYKKTACLYRALRSVLPAKVDLLTAVFGGPSFFPPSNVKQSNNGTPHQAPALPGNSAPCRTADHPIPQHSTRATHGRRHTTAPSEVPAPNAGNRKQNPAFRRAVNPFISFKIINLQRTRTL